MKTSMHSGSSSSGTYWSCQSDRSLSSSRCALGSSSSHATSSSSALYHSCPTSLASSWESASRGRRLETPRERANAKELFCPTADYLDGSNQSDHINILNQHRTMDLEIQKADEPEESTHLSKNADEDDKISDMPDEIRPYACCWNQNKPTTSIQRKNKCLSLVALLAVACFFISDVALHISNSTQIGSRTAPNTCFGLCLRSVVQMLISLVLGCAKRHYPWGRSGFRALLLVVGSVSAALIVAVDVSAEHIGSLTSSFVFMLLPVFTWIFSMTLALETFNTFTLIQLVLYALAAILLAQPQWFFTSQPAQLAPILSLDLGMSFPISVVPLDVFNMPLHYDVIGILSTIMVAVITAYLVVLAQISKGEHWSIVGFWMGLGSLIGCIFYYWNHIGFSAFSWPNPSGSLFVTAGISAIFGSLGTILFLIVLQDITPSRAVLLRCSEWILIYVFQLIFSEKIFSLGDLSACILMVLATGNIILALCCF